MARRSLSLEEMRALVEPQGSTPAPESTEEAPTAPKSTKRSLTLEEARELLADMGGPVDEEETKEAPEAKSSWRGIRDLAPNAIQEVSDVWGSTDWGGGSLRDRERELLGQPTGRNIGPIEGEASSIGAGLIGVGETVGNAVSPYIPEAVKKGGKWAIEQFLKSTYGQTIPYAMEKVSPVLDAAEEAYPDTYNTAKNVIGGAMTLGGRSPSTLKNMGDKATARVSRGVSDNVDRHLERHIPKDPDKTKVGEQVSTGPTPLQTRDTWDFGTKNNAALEEVKNLPEVKANSTAHEISRAVVNAEKKAMDDLDVVLDKHAGNLSDPETVLRAAEDALDAWRGPNRMGMRSIHSPTIDLLKDDLTRMIKDPNHPLTPRRIREIRKEVDTLINEKDFGTQGANAQSQMGLVLRKVLNEQLDLAIPDGSARALLTKWSNLETARPYTLKAANIEAPTRMGRFADEVGMKRAQTAAGVGSETQMFTSPGAGLAMVGARSVWVGVREMLGLRGMPLARAKARVGREVAEIDRILKRNPGDRTFKAKRAVLVDFLANGSEVDLEAEE